MAEEAGQLWGICGFYFCSLGQLTVFIYQHYCHTVLGFGSSQLDVDFFW